MAPATAPLTRRLVGGVWPVLFGGITACGFAPLRLWPLTLIGLAWLAGAAGGAATWRKAALQGWLFGIGLFTVGNYWIAQAFTYQEAMPRWLGPVGVVGLSFYLGLFSAFSAGLTRALAGPEERAPLALPFGFAGAWILGEWLRSWVCTGFAWNPVGVVTLGDYAHPALAGLILPWVGTYAASGLVALLAGCWLAAVRAQGWPRVALGLLPLIVLGAPWSIAPAPETGKHRFTLVQPNRPEEELNDPALWEEQFQAIAALSRSRTPDEHRLLLWPESGVPDYLRPGYPFAFYRATTFMADPALARERIGRVIGPGTLLLTGAIDLEVRKGDAIAARNVVTAIDGSGAIRGSYAKAHLVPYGEYLPMRALLEPIGLSRLVPGDFDFWEGPGPRTVDFGAQSSGGWGKVGFQLCYEIIFSGQVIDPANRPDLLFNPSNDGWFGAWGPPQHLAQARLRAIEEGVPVLRSTTTGISAVIDANGVVRQRLDHGVAGRIDGLVPPVHAPTLFARFGNKLALGWAALLVAICLVARRRWRG